MNCPEIEYLLSEAVNSRPTITGAPMNLYVYDGKIICGARAVMPIGATFVAHVPAYELENGFTEKQWKAIIEKIEDISQTQEISTTIRSQFSKGLNDRGRQTPANQARFKEKRKEERLPYSCPIWFRKAIEKRFSQARMVDVSSGGMGFTCRNDANCPQPGQKIATRFTIPRFNSDGSFDEITFNRTGRICHVDIANRKIPRVALQFAEELPFRPHERPAKKADAIQIPATVTI